MTLIVGVPGLQLLGPFPEPLQRYVTFTAARSTTPSDPGAVDELHKQLSTAMSAAALEPRGLEPVPR